MSQTAHMNVQGLVLGTVGLALILALLALLLYLCGYLVWSLSTWARQALRILRGQELIVLHRPPPPTPRERRRAWAITLAVLLGEAAYTWRYGPHRPWTHHDRGVAASLLGGLLLIAVPLAWGQWYAMRKYGWRVKGGKGEEGQGQGGSAVRLPPAPRGPS